MSELVSAAISGTTTTAILATTEDKSDSSRNRRFSYGLLAEKHRIAEDTKYYSPIFVHKPG